MRGVQREGCEKPLLLLRTIDAAQSRRRHAEQTAALLHSVGGDVDPGATGKTIPCLEDVGGAGSTEDFDSDHRVGGRKDSELRRGIDGEHFDLGGTKGGGRALRVRITST